MPNAPGYGAGKAPAYKGGKLAPRKKPKPAKKAAKPKAATPQWGAASPTGKQPLSPLAQAQALVRQELAPLYSQVTQAEAEQEAYERRKQQAIHGFTQALVSSLQGDPAAIGRDYEHAIAQTSGLAAQSAAALSGQNPNPASQALLSAVGAPAEQQAQMAAGLGATYAGGAGVMQHTEGTIPSQTFSANQLAQLAFARGLPSLAAMKGIGALQQYGFQAADERRKLTDKRLEIAAGEPALVEKARSSILEQRYKAQEAQAKATASANKEKLAWKKEARQEWYQKQSLSMRQADQEIKQAYLDIASARTEAEMANARSRLAQSQARLEVSRISLYGYDPTTGRYTPSARKQIASVTGIDPVTGQPAYVKPTAANTGKKARTGRSKAWVQLDKQIVRSGKAGLGKPMDNPDFEKGFSKMPYLTPEGKPTNNPQKAARQGRQNGDTLLTQIYQGYGTDLETRFKVPKAKIIGRIRAKLRALGYKV